MNRQGSLLLIVALTATCAGCEHSKSTASQSVSSAPTATETSADAQASLPANTSEPTAQASANESASELPPPLDLPADPNAMVDVTFDHIKFDIEPDADFERSMLTPTIEKLFDRNIRIRGYIYPTLKKRGIKQFILVRDNQECCFGPGAALYDCILVHMKEGKTAEYSIRPVAVEGKFSYEVFPDYDGTTRAIYRLDGESVE